MADGCKEFEVCQKFPRKCDCERSLGKVEEIIQQIKSFLLLLIGIRPSIKHHSWAGEQWVVTATMLSSGLGQWLLKHLLGSGVRVRQGIWKCWAALMSDLWCGSVTRMLWSKDLISPQWTEGKGNEKRKEVKGDGNWKRIKPWVFRRNFCLNRQSCRKVIQK